MNSKSQIVPRLLVTAQFALAAILVLSTGYAKLAVVQLGPSAKILVSVAAVLSVSGAVLAISAWLTMGLFKLRIMPAVRSGASLLKSGPYRIVRHPMYSGLLLFLGGFLVVDFALWRLVMLTTLGLVLFAKAKIEERHLRETFDEYPDYSRRTGMLLPKLTRNPQ